MGDKRSGPATVVRSCSEMPLFRPGNAPRSAMGSVPIKSVNLNSLPCGQTLDAQVAQLKAAGAEKVSGARADRPELARLMRTLTSGDVVLVTRLDRLARSTRDGSVAK